MKDHAQYAENLALYAIEALDDKQELADIRAHLGNCGECQRELEALRGDTALLAVSASGPNPSQRARARLMQAIASEPRVAKLAKPQLVVGHLRPRWMTFAPLAVAVALAVISIGLILDGIRLRRRYDDLAGQYQELQQNSALSREVMAMLNDPQAVRMTLVAAKTPPQPQVRTVYKPERGHLLLMANNLAPLPNDKVYEVWLLPANGSAPMAAGTFEPDKKGNTLMLHAMENPGIQAEAFAVTIEPRGGSRTPTMPMVMMPTS
ncbi:MAG TPA: anti-sigma factor [Candidatus Angelobacter sp.]|nr:anti-sigma factor [Candidatus Angelobacter sp.]